MRYDMKPQGVCARQISFDLDGDVVTNVVFTNGCNGNLKAIGKLVNGMTVEQIEGYLPWEGEPAPMTTGAINHWAFDTPDIEAAFENAKELGLKFKDTEIQHIDSFWEHGIRFFNVYGPNGETIEFCQIV